MKDLEFYTTSEEWPAPPDAPRTLADPRRSGEDAKPKKKSSGRIRKKMSESLAGVTAAAIAVVMLASSLPALKDVVDDFPFLEEIIPEITVPEVTAPVVLDGCPWCDKGNCPYMPYGGRGLTLANDAYISNEYLAYDLYQMNGFTDRDRHGDFSCHAVLTQTGQRLVLQVEGSLLSGYGPYSVRRFSDNPLLLDETKIAASGIHWDRSGADLYDYDPAEVYLYLAYSVDGDYSGLDLGADLEGFTFRATPVEGVPNAQLQVYADRDEFLADVDDWYYLEVVAERSIRYPLGDTMYFQENEDAYRTFHDEYEPVYILNPEGEDEQTWLFLLNFETKQYSTNEGNICFAEASWIDILAKMAELNEQAPKYGHQVCFPILDLGQTAVNSITYRCYAIYMDDNSQQKSVTYVCVPEQEPEILLSFSCKHSEAEMADLLSGGITADHLAEKYETLSQVTLR